ncbi:7-carboxy-7-deazaguanine synthase QueE [Rhodopirellula halodulae]|uniref:7-carboxy-7-deazaguanine synthase QueE n=1 Tax=Rhodopirellula halodulae TaxID=2894198 RepID=UPI001E36239A|nr:7-carboxy-7-deazaguanine synthase QueE [Rhodopirellula sp. JC737]MCC9656468.1 7-carboxy-7-deazaguanine synthase QueE [Rhodopirellula sp. JC737]
MKSADRPVDVLPAEKLAKTPGSADADASTFLISETFVSRQGEGSLTGQSSVFLRTSGCNLRCWFCDTPYASWNPEGTRQTIDELLQLVSDADTSHVVLTGGEPLVASGIVQLVDRLREAGNHVTIETAGTVDPGVRCDLLSLSPKLRASTPDENEHPRWAKLHEQRRLPIQTMRTLIQSAEATQVKFVVDSADEMTEIDEVISQLRVSPEQVWLMPQGVSVQELDAAKPWLLSIAESRGYHYCDRMHIRWYGNRRGT